LTLAELGKAAKEFLGGDQAENCVPQKFKLLIVFGPLTGPLRFQFASLRAVSDSLLQQFWRKELMAKRLLQCEKF
jgi:hypothetical protein